MDPYGPEAAEALAAWSKQALDMYAWPLDPSFDWSRYACPKCGQILTTIVQVGLRFPVMRPDPHYLAHRPAGSKLSLFEMNLRGHHNRHRNPWHPKRGRPSYEDRRAPPPAGFFLAPRRDRNPEGGKPSPPGNPPRGRVFHQKGGPLHHA